MAQFDTSTVDDLIKHDFPDYVLAVNQLPSAENFDLYHAAAKGDVKNVLFALAAGGKPNFFNVSEEQKTSLHVAAANGHTEVVKLLLEKGAVINCIVAATKVICPTFCFI